MKVVLFCGGFGTRLREHSDTIPKPLVDIGNRPIIWHLMKYYAHFGHKEFVLCLGYKGEMIKEFFLNYDSYRYRDFVLREGGEDLDPPASDIKDWTIHFVDTGLHANIGERLLAVRSLVEGEDVFLANYTDQLTNFPLPDLIEFHNNRGCVASFLSVRPAQSFHRVQLDEAGMVTQMGVVREGDIWINGGYMVLQSKIFEYIEPGDELVEAPFCRLIRRQKLASMCWDGFYAAMDTFKDKIMFDRMNGRGERPWEVWKDGEQ
jgi:glucose-1-phosphate cytidylyltransferase